MHQQLQSGRCHLNQQDHLLLGGEVEAEVLKVLHRRVLEELADLIINVEVLT